ncbi:hypothetical protein [Streptomyces sp. PTY087I2]|uniref:hypothetical protein n=1 Tax=Streptomyces sp. PTY087I2 TaxID=1819298 RepID=UPI0021005C6B|nr:hypothetical protein [Streptomyces sp. PTY087I2]
MRLCALRRLRVRVPDDRLLRLPVAGPRGSRRHRRWCAEGLLPLRHRLLLVVRLGHA